MSNTEDFDTEAGDLDAEFGGEEEAAAPAPEEEAPAPQKKKSGGAGKFLFLLLVLLLGGGAAAVKLELVQLPFEIPGLTPPAQVAVKTPPPAVPAPAAKPEDTPPPGVSQDKGSKDGQPQGGGMMPSAIGASETEQPAIRPPGSIAMEGDPLADPFAAAPPPAGAAPAETQAAVAPAGELGEPPAADGAEDVLALPGAGAVPPTDTDIATVPETTASGADPFDPLAAGTASGGAEPQDPFAGGEDTAAAPQAAPAPVETDPFATPGGPKMQAAPVAPVESGPAAASAPGNPAQQARIRELETRVAALEKDLAAATKRAEDAEKQAAADKEAARKAGERAAKAEATAKTATAGTDNSGAVPVRRARPRPAVAAEKPAPAPRWVLKSAKPGVAWVAAPGSNELKAISVGETLPGIGRVTAVAKDSGGRWVVSGTKGMVSQ